MVSLLWKAGCAIASCARRAGNWAVAFAVGLCQAVVSGVLDWGYCAAMALFGLALAPVVAFATDPVSLPDTGVDMAGTVDALTTGLGGVVLKIVLAFAAYLLIRFGMKWFKRLA